MGRDWSPQGLLPAQSATCCLRSDVNSLITRHSIWLLDMSQRDVQKSVSGLQKTSETHVLSILQERECGLMSSRIHRRTEAFCLRPNLFLSGSEMDSGSR